MRFFFFFFWPKFCSLRAPTPFAWRRRASSCSCVVPGSWRLYCVIIKPQLCFWVVFLCVLSPVFLSPPSPRYYDRFFFLSFVLTQPIDSGSVTLSRVFFFFSNIFLTSNHFRFPTIFVFQPFSFRFVVVFWCSVCACTTRFVVCFLLLRQSKPDRFDLRAHGWRCSRC